MGFFESSSSSSTPILLTRDHAWVLAVVVLSWFLHHVLCLIGVMKARKKYGVKYPTLYASEGDGVTKEHAHRFNCVQRGHQNCLETLPTFLSLLLTAGLAYPRAASGAGVLYLLGRWMYFKGYSTGDPAKRMQGSLHHFALFSLVGMVILCAINIYRM